MERTFFPSILYSLLGFILGPDQPSLICKADKYKVAFTRSSLRGLLVATQWPILYGFFGMQLIATLVYIRVHYCLQLNAIFSKL